MKSSTRKLSKLEYARMRIAQRKMQKIKESEHRKAVTWAKAIEKQDRGQPQNSDLYQKQQNDEEKFTLLLSGDVFTFLVGPDREKYDLHIKAVAEHSTALAAMMTGHMREAQEKVVLLPEVSKDVFGRFASFIYQRDYHVPEPAPTVQTIMNPETNDHAAQIILPLFPDYTGVTRRYLLVDGSKFNCCACRDQVSLPERLEFFPYCDLKCFDNYTKGKKKPNCSGCCQKTRVTYPGSLCQSCCPNFSPAISSEQLGSYCQELTTRTNHVAMQKLLISWFGTSKMEYIRESCKRFGTIDSFDIHVEIYKFAETYEILNLMILSLYKTSCVLGSGWDDERLREKVIEKLDAMSETVTAVELGGPYKGDPLKLILTHFITHNISSFKKQPSLAEFVSKGGNEARRIFEAALANA